MIFSFDLRNVWCLFTAWEVALRHEIIDHTLKSYRATVVGGIDAGNAVLHKVADLLRQDHSSAATKNSDMAGASFSQKVHHVSEVFVVPALVAGHCDGLCIFLYSSGDNFFNRTIVSKMYHFTPGRLYDAAHDIDCRIMAIKKTGRGHYPDLILGLVGLRRFVACKIRLLLLLPLLYCFRTHVQSFKQK